MQTFIYPSKQRTDIEPSVNLQLVRAIKIITSENSGSTPYVTFVFDKQHVVVWNYDNDEDMIYDAMHKLGDACPEWIKPEWPSNV